MYQTCIQKLRIVTRYGTSLRAWQRDVIAHASTKTNLYFHLIKTTLLSTSLHQSLTTGESSLPLWSYVGPTRIEGARSMSR